MGDFQSCLVSQVQDNIDNTSATSFGSYEFVEEQDQEYLNLGMETGYKEFDLLNSNIVSEKDLDLFPGGNSNLFGTHETESIHAFTLDKSTTTNEQLTIATNYTKHEEYFFEKKSSKYANDNFNPSSNDENNATIHIIETEDTNTIPELHLTEDTPNF